MYIVQSRIQDLQTKIHLHFPLLMLEVWRFRPGEEEKEAEEEEWRRGWRGEKKKREGGRVK